MHFATKAIRAGHRVDPVTHALNTPIYETSTFAFDTSEAYVESTAAALRYDADSYFYSRTANPTTAALERKIAALEGADAAAVTACGIGAVSSTLMTLLNAGDHCIVSDDVFIVTKLSLQELYPANKCYYFVFQ